MELVVFGGLMALTIFATVVVVIVVKDPEIARIAVNALTRIMRRD